MTTALTTALPAPAGTQLPAGAVSCTACPHPLEAHDRISLRFCEATRVSSSSRGCACST
ncbi:RGCVC family protein [Blastococcus sp. SYSU DS0619]